MANDCRPRNIKERLQKGGNEDGIEWEGVISPPIIFQTSNYAKTNHKMKTAAINMLSDMWSYIEVFNNPGWVVIGKKEQTSSNHNQRLTDLIDFLLKILYFFK